MSQPPSEEHRKFVFVFTGAPTLATGESRVDALRGFARKVLGWEVEMESILPLSARVEIKEVDDKPPADEQEKVKS